MKSRNATTPFVLLFSAAVLAQAPAPSAPLLAEPGISPDGREIAFASGGDIWAVAAGGGDAHLLVSHPATESRPLYAPNGRALAFVSNRTGNGDIYVLRFDDASVTRLTFDDGAETLDGWSRDGNWIYFSSNTREIAGMNDVHRIAATGGTPMPVTSEAYTSEYFGAPSPDASWVAFSARGIAAGQWWRRGRSHIDESEIWVRRPGSAEYHRIVDRGAKALWPMWGDASTLFFMSDRGGAENIWSVGVGKGAAEGQPRQVTRFDRGRVLWPSITTDGRTVAFERDFGIWTADTASGKTAAVRVQLRGAPATPVVERQRQTAQFSGLSLSPDGKKVAFVARGDVFAASAKDGGDAERVTATPGREFDLAWTPDSRRLIYSADRNGAHLLASYDFVTARETLLTSGSADDYAHRVSPSGTEVAFIRARREVRVMNLDTRADRVVATGDLPWSIDGGRPLAWSPDGKWIAYVNSATRGFTNVHLVPAAGGPNRPVTFLANLNTDSVAWSPDGTFLTFATGQRTEVGQVGRVDLILRTPKFREDQFRSLFDQETPRPNRSAPPADPATSPAAPSAPPPPASPASPGAASASPAPPPAPAAVTPVFDEIRRRLRLLPVGVAVLEQTVSPDGKWVLMVASAASQTNLYLYSIDELAREPAVTRQLTSTAGAKNSAQFSPDSKEVYYLDDGRIQIATVENRQTRPLAVTAEVDIDFTRERMAVFTQAWTYLRDFFFDEKLNGVDWTAARESYGARVAASRTPDEMRRAMSLMIGELNASHLGISAPGGAGGGPTTGRLGLRFDAAIYQATGRLRVTEVLPLGAAAVTQSVSVGDYLLAIDGRPLDRESNVDERLQHTINKRVVLTLSGTPDGPPASRRDVPVRPTNLQTEKALMYRDWVEKQRALVEKLSNGRLGYAHMIDMGAPSLEQFHVDLDVDNHAKDGVVIDVRNNNGGFVNVYAIDVLARRSYFDMTPRGSQRVPSRSVLGQRSLERPTVLVTNQHSLSDAEDFTEGYRALGLGKVVGEPTAGWIIYTRNQPLVDGSVLRLPGFRITARDGSDMEMRPRPVDVRVTRPIGEGLSGRDTQLEAAVRELLAQIDKRGTQR